MLRIALGLVFVVPLALGASSCDTVTDVPDDQLEITVRQRAPDDAVRIVGETRTTQPVGGFAPSDVPATSVALEGNTVEMSVNAHGATDVAVLVAFQPTFSAESKYFVVTPDQPVRFDTGGGLEGTLRPFRLAGFGAEASQVDLRVTSGPDQTTLRVDRVVRVDPGAWVRGGDLRPLDDPVSTAVQFTASGVDAPLLAVVRFAPDAYDVERLDLRRRGSWTPGRTQFDAAAFDARLYVLQGTRRGR